MRLINCESQPLLLEELVGLKYPPYVILSHTWEAKEVTFEQFARHDARTSLKGWAKVQQTCSLDIQNNVNYVWIDTCCIDKSSSAELTEAINSMFQWYMDATICFAYLSDYTATVPAQESLRQARWFTRGWTLQEPQSRVNRKTGKMVRARLITRRRQVGRCDLAPVSRFLQSIQAPQTFIYYPCCLYSLW